MSLANVASLLMTCALSSALLGSADATDVRKDRVVLVAGGTRGDTQPLIALGVDLQKAGFKITLLAAPDQTKWASIYGFDAVVAMDSFRDSIKGDEFLGAACAQRHVFTVSSYYSTNALTVYADADQNRCDGFRRRDGCSRLRARERC